MSEPEIITLYRRKLRSRALDRALLRSKLDRDVPASTPGSNDPRAAHIADLLKRFDRDTKRYQARVEEYDREHPEADSRA